MRAVNPKKKKKRVGSVKAAVAHSRLQKTIAHLREELEECKETLRAIQQGEVDALVVSDGSEERIFTLKSADQPYRVFVETMNEGAATLGSDGLIYYCNQRFAEMIHKPLEQVMGHSIHDLFPNNALPNFDEILARGKHAKGNRAFLNYTAGGMEIPLQISMSVVQLEDSLGICVVATDLTEQHRLEESRADVERLNIEKEIRERFVSTLTHDLRTPLTAGLLAGQLLMRKDFNGDDVKKIAGRIAANMERADGMIRDLLDTNRLKAGEGLPIHIQKTDPNQVIDNAVKTLSDIYGPRFKVKSKANATEVFWDPVAIQRCIENLAANAVKYGFSKTPILISSKASAGKVTLSVQNEGNPIPKEDLGTLFNPYRRTAAAEQSAQKGWGIGLTLVSGFTESHSGKATVKSDSESGTTFSIELPIDARKKG